MTFLTCKLRVFFFQLFGCEYLVDLEIAKQSGWVMAPLVEYCVNTMGYEKEKSIDAMPYE